MSDIAPGVPVVAVPIVDLEVLQASINGCQCSTCTVHRAAAGPLIARIPERHWEPSPEVEHEYRRSVGCQNPDERCLTCIAHIRAARAAMEGTA